MIPEEYNSLPIDDRGELLWGQNGKGKFVEWASDYGKAKIGLYLLEDLVVSVHYDINTNEIKNIRAWENSTPYMDITQGISMN